MEISLTASGGLWLAYGGSFLTPTLEKVFDVSNGPVVSSRESVV